MLWFSVLVLTCLPLGHPARAQDVGPNKPISRFNQGSFRIAGPARAAMHELWMTSTAAKQERAACLGGYVQDSVVYITRVEPLASSHADSANISASTSLRVCAPPQWFGTVHTHIATFHGRPYTTFSAPDRFVMMLWNQRWKEHGVFCILYSDADANCEFGYDLSSHAQYAYRQGTRLIF